MAALLVTASIDPPAALLLGTILLRRSSSDAICILPADPTIFPPPPFLFNPGEKHLSADEREGVHRYRLFQTYEISREENLYYNNTEVTLPDTSEDPNSLLCYFKFQKITSKSQLTLKYKLI